MSIAEDYFPDFDEDRKRTPTRKQRRQANRKTAAKGNRGLSVVENIRANFQLKNISPITENQRLTFKAFDQGKNLLLHGYAGTGKSFISMYLALEEVMSGQSKYKQVIIVRSAVPSRDMGFMPGSQADKMKVFEEPYELICSELFGRGDAYTILKQKNIIKFTTTSYLRGLTFSDAIVIVDECQNANFGELTTVMTRIGNNALIMFCGDYRQNDLNKKNDESGLKDFMRIICSMPSFEDIEFDINDIVRSGVVKEFIIVREKLNL